MGRHIDTAGFRQRLAVGQEFALIQQIDPQHRHAAGEQRFDRGRDFAALV